MKYCVEVITEGNNEVSEILGVSWDDMENEILYGGCYPPKKIQVRPDLEGHAVRKWDSHENETQKTPLNTVHYD